MLKWIMCLQKKNHIWINYKLKGHRCWKNAFSSSISSLIFLLACIYLLSHSSLPCVINMCVWKAENNYVLSASTWQWQALWATDWPLSQGEGILWAFDWPLPEEILCISDWLGSVIFHLSGPRTHTVIVWLWQEPPLYSKCVNVSFLSSDGVLRGRDWGWAQCCPSHDKSRGSLSGHLSSGGVQHRKQIFNSNNAETHFISHWCVLCANVHIKHIKLLYILVLSLH